MRQYTTAVTSVRNERGALVRPFDARDALGRALESAGRARVGPETGTDPAPSLVVPPPA
jgi:hypothetical protein